MAPATGVARGLAAVLGLLAAFPGGVHGFLLPAVAGTGLCARPQAPDSHSSTRLRMSGSASAPDDDDARTQTNTGRFHKLVDFDHTGMDDKQFREALKEKMKTLREASPGNR